MAAARDSPPTEGPNKNETTRAELAISMNRIHEQPPDHSTIASTTPLPANPTPKYSSTAMAVAAAEHKAPGPVAVMVQHDAAGEAAPLSSINEVKSSQKTGSDTVRGRVLETRCSLPGSITGGRLTHVS